MGFKYCIDKYYNSKQERERCLCINRQALVQTLDKCELNISHSNVIQALGSLKRLETISIVTGTISIELYTRFEELTFKEATL